MKKLIILAVLALFACGKENTVTGPSCPVDPDVAALQPIVGEWTELNTPTYISKLYFFYDHTVISSNTSAGQQSGTFEFYNDYGFLRLSSEPWQSMALDSDTLYVGLSEYIKK